jgi:hypothetical protein
VAERAARRAEQDQQRHPPLPDLRHQGPEVGDRREVFLAAGHLRPGPGTERDGGACQQESPPRVHRRLRG